MNDYGLYDVYDDFVNDFCFYVFLGYYLFEMNDDDDYVNDYHYDLLFYQQIVAYELELNKNK